MSQGFVNDDFDYRERYAQAVKYMVAMLRQTGPIEITLQEIRDVGPLDEVLLSFIGEERESVVISARPTRKGERIG